MIAQHFLSLWVLMPVVNSGRARWSQSLPGLGLAPMCANFVTKKLRIISSSRPTSGPDIARNPSTGAPSVIYPLEKPSPSKGMLLSM